MAFLNPYQDILKSYLTTFCREGLLLNGFDVEYSIFYDFSLFYTIGPVINSLERLEIDNYISLFPFSSGERGRFLNENTDFSIGKVKEISIDGQRYVCIPYFRLLFNENTVKSAKLDGQTSLLVECVDKESVLERVERANESLDGSMYVTLNGKVYKFVENFVFCGIEEVGVDEELENFDIFLSEEDILTGESKFIPLLMEKRLFDGTVFLEKLDNDVVELLVDNEIPREILCKYVVEENKPNSVVFRNSGVVNINKAGFSCNDGGKDFVKVYVGRKEGQLGGEC